ncbi:MAG: nuclear transport factor 2 family protein, partial [Bryobacteraceae bacterium]
QYVAQDDNVVVIGQYSGVVNSTGKTIDVPVVFTFEVRGGSVKRHMVITDTAAQAASYTASSSTAAS